MIFGAMLRKTSSNMTAFAVVISLAAVMIDYSRYGNDNNNSCCFVSFCTRRRTTGENYCIYDNITSD
jgi:hypothetical protein